MNCATLTAISIGTMHSTSKKLTLQLSESVFSAFVWACIMLHFQHKPCVLKSKVFFPSETGTQLMGSAAMEVNVETAPQDKSYRTLVWQDQLLAKQNKNQTSSCSRADFQLHCSGTLKRKWSSELKQVGGWKISVPFCKHKGGKHSHRTNNFSIARDCLLQVHSH